MVAEAKESVGQETLHICEVAKQFPQPNRKPRSLATVMRWILTGVRIKTTGEFIKLAAFRAGSSWYTTQADVDEFVRRQTEASAVVATTGNPSRSIRRSVSKRTERSKASLRAKGILK